MKLVKTIVVSLVVAGLLAIAQHHHDDFDGHDDCPVCALVQDGLGFNDDTPHVAVFWVVLFALVGVENACKANSHFHFYRPRGPPAFFA